jgi:hypothetical protein
VLSTAKRRVELSEGRYVRIDEFMGLHLDKKKRELVINGGTVNIMSSEITVHNRKKSNVYTTKLSVGKATAGAVQLIDQSGPSYQRKTLQRIELQRIESVIICFVFHVMNLQFIFFFSFFRIKFAGIGI